MLQFILPHRWDTRWSIIHAKRKPVSLPPLECSKALFQNWLCIHSDKMNSSLTIPLKLWALYKSRATRNTTDCCPLTSSHPNIFRWPANPSRSWGYEMSITWWRGIITPIKGNEAVISKGWGHMCYQPSVLFCLPGGVRWVKNTRCSRASSPSWLLPNCSWPRKVKQNFMKNIPSV